MKWYHGLETIVEEDKPLAEHTWYQLGGPARYFCTPRTPGEVSTVLKRCREHGLPLKVLGDGANVLIRDHGFDGVVVHLDPGGFNYVNIDGRCVCAGAANELPDLVRRTVRQGLAGLEVLAGIPGTVGGAVRMNAGGKFGDIGQRVQQVRIIDAGGAERTLDQNALGFRYRRTNLTDCVVIDATFLLEPEDAAALNRRYRQIWEFKRSAQPFTRNNAGCMFKNPEGLAAGALIDRLGFKGARCGGARVCEQHANFIVTEPQATSADILALAERVRRAVRDQFKVDLEYEIDIW